MKRADSRLLIPSSHINILVMIDRAARDIFLHAFGDKCLIPVFTGQAFYRVYILPQGIIRYSSGFHFVGLPILSEMKPERDLTNGTDISTNFRSNPSCKSSRIVPLNILVIIDSLFDNATKN